MSGIRNAKTVISVNKDADAAINSNSDFFVVDDIAKLLPAMLSKLNEKFR